MTFKPKYHLCWHCNRKFRGNHFTAVIVQGVTVYVHKACANEV